MYIYPSLKAMPYVYLCTHKTTKEFYVGYRYANKIPSHLDIIKYKTSSKNVRPIFDQFNWQILAEFFDADSAYSFEQELIQSFWGDPLLINKWVGPHGSKRSQATEETRKRRGLANKGKVTSDKTKKLISIAKTGKKDQIVTCPHCGKSGGVRNMKRYHFDNCNSVRREKYLLEMHKIAYKQTTGKKWYPTNRASVIQPVVTCPHCGKSGGIKNMTRYHFDNCKCLKHQLIISAETTDTPVIPILDAAALDRSNSRPLT